MFLKSILFLFVLTLSINAITETKKETAKKTFQKRKKPTAIKIKPIKECKELLNGKFLDYNLKKSEPPGSITRENGFSYFVSGNRKAKSKIEMIDDCKLEFTYLEYEDPALSKETIERILNFKPIENVYKFEGNKAYYKGFNCECEGYYERIE